MTGRKTSKCQLHLALGSGIIHDYFSLHFIFFYNEVVDIIRNNLKQTSNNNIVCMQIVLEGKIVIV